MRWSNHIVTNILIHTIHKNLDTIYWSCKLWNGLWNLTLWISWSSSWI